MDNSTLKVSAQVLRKRTTPKHEEYLDEYKNSMEVYNIFTHIIPFMSYCATYHNYLVKYLTTEEERNINISNRNNSKILNNKSLKVQL